MNDGKIQYNGGDWYSLKEIFEMPFVIDEEEMIDLIEQRLQEEGE